MEIVIAGAGEVGVYLARMLSNEKHNITLIDMKEEKLEYASTHYEILTHVGSCSTIDTLKEVGVSRAKLFIAVTESEEVNITSSILAKKLGAKRVLCRVDNQQYIKIENKEFLDSLCIDEFVYPEALASQEIVSSLKITGAHLINEFTENGLSLFSTVLQSSSKLIGKTLIEVREDFDTDDFRAVAIKRDDSTIIPKGHHRFKEKDLLFIVSKNTAIKGAMNLCGCQEFKLRNIMILGGSRIGLRTAMALENKYNVKLIEEDREKSITIANMLPKTLIVNGDGRSEELLKEEDIRNMDVFIAVTGNSESNIFSCLLAKKLGVKTTIAEVENTDFIKLAGAIGIETIINKKLIAASSIYKHTTNAEVRDFKLMTDVDADILELVAKKKSSITRNPIKNIKFPEGVVVGAIIRGKEEIIAYGDSQIEAGDRVVVFALPHAVKKVEKLFN